jgi:hypothetical protein
MTVHPAPPPGSTLRQRMIEDMTVRGFTEKTQHDYIRCVKTFAAFLGRSPDRATAEDLRRFQLHQTQVGLRPGISSSSAIRRASATVAPLPPSWHPCAGRTGSSTPSLPSQALRLCWPICRAIPTASRSPTLG